MFKNKKTARPIKQTGEYIIMKKTVSIIIALALISVFALALSSCGKEKLVVYTEAGFAPFEYIENGKIVGVDVEIMNLVGKKLGKDVVFENVAFNTIIDAVNSGKLCNVGAAGISITDARKEKVDFSNEYYTANLYVIYKTSEKSSFESTTTDNVTGVYWGSLAGKNIAVQDGTTADLFLTDEIGEDWGALYGSGTKKTGFSELATALADVGVNCDALIIDELPAQMLVDGKSQYSCAPLYYQGGDGEADEAAFDVYAICVTPGQTELLDAINEVLDELGTEGIQKLVNKHLGLG